MLELLLDGQVALAVGLDQRHLVTLVDQLAGQVPADLAGPDDQHVLALARAANHEPSPVPTGAPAMPRSSVSSSAIAVRVGQIVRSPRCSYHSAR